MLCLVKEVKVILETLVIVVEVISLIMTTWFSGNCSDPVALVTATVVVYMMAVEMAAVNLVTIEAILEVVVATMIWQLTTTTLNFGPM